MKTKIARNVEKLSNILGKDNILNDSINILLNNSRKYNHLKLRVKETKYSRQRPKAPHNTTQYLSKYYQENRDSEQTISITQMSLDHLNKENSYSIENFIITGGSLKEFFKNVNSELDIAKENRNIIINSFLKNLS